MLHCPTCSSRNHKVSAYTPKDMPDGKTRRRECLDCKTKFFTMESVFIYPAVEKNVKKKPKTTIKNKFSRNGKRILRPRKPMPSLEIEPDFDDLTDEELEAHIFSN
jgi:transcriptional regulator NrdR family protein